MCFPGDLKVNVVHIQHKLFRWVHMWNSGMNNTQSLAHKKR
jgi:hypothetical protein